jgi:hypothetical protein
MALGGGTFLVQNKVLPGSYINFISLAKANANLSDRGFATMPLELDWGVDGAVFEVTNADFQKNSVKIFGYDYTHEKLKGLRDLFMNIKTLYAYRLNSGVKATNSYATAKYSGIRGNDLKVIIQVNVDDSEKFDVSLLLDTTVIDSQTVASSASLVDNDFVVWNKTATLAATAGTALATGTNGTVDGAAHQTYLDKIEAYSFNVMGLVSADSTTQGLYANFCKRMRDEVGAKFQVVLYNQASDYEGIINLKNAVSDNGVSAASLVYWVTGIAAGCAVNKSNLNKKYDGEFTVSADYTQAQLEAAINAGEFTLHKVGMDIRVLSDINSLVTTSDTKGDVFKDNQSIRVIDQIANDIATLFNTKYLGTVPNDASGRISLWADIVKHHEQLQEIRAIENFNDADVIVEQGDTKKAVVVSDLVTVVNAMAQLYMTVKVA